jgi:hypothetical protein
MFDKTKDERIAKLEAHALQREYSHPYPCWDTPFEVNSN